MHKAVQHLISSGYRDIAVESYDWHEDSGGWQDECETTVLVGRNRDGRPIRVRHMTGTGGYRRGEVTETPINEEEYAKSLAEHGVKDTPEYRSAFELAAREAALKQQRSREAQKQFEPLRPSCPVCGARMELRPSKFGPVPWFWGCPNFNPPKKRGVRPPSCKGTRSIDAAEWARLEPLVKGGA